MQLAMSIGILQTPIEGTQVASRKSQCANLRVLAATILDTNILATRSSHLLFPRILKGNTPSIPLDISSIHMLWLQYPQNDPEAQLQLALQYIIANPGCSIRQTAATSTYHNQLSRLDSMAGALQKRASRLYSASHRRGEFTY
jgi:hypothetical protein